MNDNEHHHQQQNYGKHQKSETTSTTNESTIMKNNDNEQIFNDNNNPLYRKMTVQIVADKSALLCKNGCGFYGNREWDGFCSICYKEIRHLQQTNNMSLPDTFLNISQYQPSPSTTTSPPPPLSSLSGFLKPRNLNTENLNRTRSATSLTNSASSFLSNSTASLSFRKFEEKKRQQSDKKSIKSIFKRASTFREYRSSSTTSSQSSSGANENNNNNNNNNSWPFFSLEKPLMSPNIKGFGEEVLAKLFPDYAIHDINSNVMKCVEKVNKLLNRGCTIEELTEIIHDFYSIMDNRFQTAPQYKNVNNAQYNQLIDQTEKILMNKLYLNLFAKVQSEEEERDLELQKKIRNLNWIMSNHLDIDINLRHPKVKDLMDQAITEIIELDSKHIPYEKLESIVQCSKTIFEMLQIDNNDAISADQFLPALVFVIINANPPLLQSNIKFITRFSTPSRLMTGEAGYYFTNLCCATTFIEKISGQSLNMSESDFQSYINGEAQPPGYYKQSFLCEPFRVMNSNHTILNDTIKRYNQWNESLSCLETRMDRFEESLKSRCKMAINSSNDIIKQCSKYKIIDDDNIDPSLLPSHFRDLSIEYKNQRTTTATSEELLIDVTDETNNNDNNNNADDTIANESKTNDHFNHIFDDDDLNNSLTICDHFNSLDLLEQNTNQMMIKTNNDGDGSVTDNLPPPLCPEIVSKSSTSK